MIRRKGLQGILCVLTVLVGCVGAVQAQVHVHRRALAANVVVPQSRSFAIRGGHVVSVTKVDARISILEQTAKTTLDIHLKNPSGRVLEAELIVPVPQGSAVREFAFEGKASEPTAEILPKDEAKRIYSTIVAKMKDPALLEFIGYNLVRSSVFPVPARGTQKVRLTYEHILAADGDRIDYELPRTESLAYVVPWDVTVHIRSHRPISTLYSPSHKIETARFGNGAVRATVAKDARLEPGPFRLSYLVERNGVTASLLAYPDMRVKGGYFLLLAGLPAKLPKGKDGPVIKREVTLVLDRSGSMNGEKIEQVREAALQVIAALEEGEAFNIIVYNESVESFSPKPVRKTDETVQAARLYLKSIRAGGGTNIHDALLEALRQKPVNAHLPMVLFLTDGLPTIGQTSEVAIRNVAMKANPFKRRIFTFGVGVDVNTPLLDKIALETRATATYVLPKEDVEVKVASVFKRLAGPVLAGASLEVRGADGNRFAVVSDVMPAKIPDLFQGDQLVLLGKYIGKSPKLTFLLSGNYLGRKRTFRFRFTTDKATTRNAFVPRLWASRRIAVLVEAIRQLGADANTKPATVAHKPDPRLKELVDEIVRLSKDFGILTEYTAFLAREGTDLANNEVTFKKALGNFDRYAIRKRSGMASVSQSWNNDYRYGQQEMNRRNYMLDYSGNGIANYAEIQQLNDSTFYQRGGQWVDSRLVEEGKNVRIDKVVLIGSEEFITLAEDLAKEGRASSLAVKGDLLLKVKGRRVLATASTQRMNAEHARMRELRMKEATK